MSLILEDQSVTVADNIISIVDKFLADLPSNMIGEYLKVETVTDFCLDIRCAAKEST